MSERFMPAAAVPVGASLQLADGDRLVVITVARIRRADPTPGQMVIEDDTGREWAFTGAQRVQIVSLP